MIFYPTNREEIRLKAIETASEILMRDGNLSLRMDDVAQILSVSKRTLYEIFGSKEELIIECMKLHMERFSKLLEDEIGHEDDVLSVIIRHMEIIINESREREHHRFEDMDKYPKLKKMFNQHLCDVAKHMRGFMNLGVEQGVFRDDLNMNVVVKAFSVMGNMVKEESCQQTYDYEELINGTMVVLLRGIATPKGMAILDQYRYKSIHR